MTMKFVIVFYIMICLCNSLANANNASVKIFHLKPTRSLIYHLSVDFLKSCDLNLKRIIIYDNVTDQDTFSAIAEIQPSTSVSLLSDVIAWQQAARYRFDDIKVDAVVIVLNVTIPWILMKNLFRLWPFNRNCIVYIVPVPLDDCAKNGTILKLIMRFYFSVAYYICLFNDQFTRVYTHDPYGDTRPPYWNKIFQGIRWGKNWTFYGRSYDKDIRELCPGFYFKRSDPTNVTFPILGVPINVMFKGFGETGDWVVKDYEMEPYLRPSFLNEVHNLKRLLKVKFNYYIVKPPRREELLNYAYGLSSIDVLLTPRITIFQDPWWYYFYSVHIESYAILSHNRGFMTPLEKIAQFYGVWTLISLTVILCMTFIVIWLKTKKVSLAFFDTIKLLINSDVVVPINTRALKIYFSAVFLYFLIIHATFSGHLPEFLTKMDYKPNIETLEDLKDSRIEKIYHFGYKFDGIQELDDLQRKSQAIWMSTECSRIRNELNSACIAPLSDVIETWVEIINYNDIYYISKNTFGLSLPSPIYRPGFPLREKFNWAFIYLFDTSISIEVARKFTPSDLKLFNKEIATAFIEHRSVQINDLYFAFVLLIIGNCGAFICFLFEIGFKTIIKKRNYRIVINKSFVPMKI